jgi:phage tail sheath gpL-like
MGLTRMFRKWFAESVPQNAAKATGTLTFSNVVSDGQTVTIGNEVYEFDTHLTGAVTAGNIRVNVSGGASASQAVTALVAAITANSAIVTAVDGTGDTVVVTAKLVGDEYNYNVAETCANATWGAGVTALSGGQYATECHCPAYYISSVGVWYICESPVDQYDTAGWKSMTPTVVS